MECIWISVRKMVCTVLIFHIQNYVAAFVEKESVPKTGTAIQAVYSVQGETRIRETGNLIKIAKEFSESCRYLIITYEEETVIEENGVEIEVIPLYKFLLDTMLS